MSYRQGKVPLWFNFVFVLAILLVVFVVGGLIFGWPFAKTPQDKIGIHVNAGPFEGQTVEGVIEPGSGLQNLGFFDNLYEYPATQRSYVVSSVAGEGDREGGDVITAPSQNGVQMVFELGAYFKLCQTEECITDFHREIGVKYSAFEDDPGTNADGWGRMLNDYIRQQIENSVQIEARQYTTEELYFDENTLRVVQDSVGAVIKERINEAAGGEYFCGPTYTPTSDTCPDFEFTIKRIYPMEADQRAAFERVQESETLVQVRQNEVRQAELQAQAIKKLTAKEHLTPEYVTLKAIESGKITFWVLNGQDVNLSVPPGSTTRP